MTIQTFVAADTDLLLLEFNHRLFNTFQVLASELAKCGRAREADDLRARLGGVEDQLQAMAALHRVLARPHCVTVLEDYCRTLCILLVQAFGREDVIPWIEMDDIWLTPEQILKTALCVVELVTNVLKHSLTPGVGGTVWIELRAARGWAEVSVCDSRAAPAAPHAAPHILSALAMSLHGKAFVADRGGYAAGVRFPYAEPASDWTWDELGRSLVFAVGERPGGPAHSPEPRA